MSQSQLFSECRFSSVLDIPILVKKQTPREPKCSATLLEFWMSYRVLLPSNSALLLLYLNTMERVFRGIDLCVYVAQIVLNDKSYALNRRKEEEQTQNHGETHQIKKTSKSAIAQDHLNVIRETWPCLKRTLQNSGDEIFLKYFETFPNQLSKLAGYQKESKQNVLLKRLVKEFTDTLESIQSSALARTKIHSFTEAASFSHMNKTMFFDFLNVFGVFLCRTLCQNSHKDVCNSWLRLLSLSFH